MNADFKVEDEGNIFLLRPLTKAANAWITEHIPDEAQFFGGAVVIEHSYILSVIDGIQADGLEVL